MAGQSKSFTDFYKRYYGTGMTVFYSILFLIIEVGALFFFTSHRLLSGGISIILLILIAKNVYVLYTALKKKQPQENKTQQEKRDRSNGVAAEEVPVKNKSSFSDAALMMIDRALSEATIANSLFGYTVSAERLKAGFGYGEGLEIYPSEGRFACEYHRERSNDIEYEDSEAAAVSRFIRACKTGMTMRR